MFVKVLHQGKEQMYACQNTTKTTYPEDGHIVFEITPGPTLELPGDADAIFVMNDKGDTIDSVRAPKEGRKK